MSIFNYIARLFTTPHCQLSILQGMLASIVAVAAVLFLGVIGLALVAVWKALTTGMSK
ncbi:MAG: hypothetical protein ACYC9K_01080 [Sulfuricaulis sp.]